MNLRDLALRVRALFVPRQVDRELHEELAFHLERETQKHIAAGLNPAEARARSRARFGSVALAADQCRDARGTAFVDTLARDALYAFRSFHRAPIATCLGSSGLRGEPAGHRHVLRAGSVGPRLACGSHRSDRDAQKRLRPFTARVGNGDYGGTALVSQWLLSTIHTSVGGE